MPLRIATWNVNSVRQRLDHLRRFTESHAPDVLCLQEIKVASEDFPLEAIQEFGYPHAVVHGQKGYNGVAILSKRRLTAPRKEIWCDRDDCRHAAVSVGGIELHNFYVPAGGDVPDPDKNDKFAHKLQFLTEMAAWAEQDRAGRSPGRRDHFRSRTTGTWSEGFSQVRVSRTISIDFKRLRSGSVTRTWSRRQP